jgi:hypothetical protein
LTAPAAGEGSDYGVYIRSGDMSDDGRYVTYVSMSTDIEGLPAYGPAQVFRFDAAAEPGRVDLSRLDPADGTAADSQSYATAISADGRYVAFTTTATNLAAPALAPNATALVVRDMAEGTLTRADVIETGAAFESRLHLPAGDQRRRDRRGLPVARAETRSAASTPGAPITSSWRRPSPSVRSSASFAMAGGAGSIEVNTTAVSGWNAASLDPWIVLTTATASAAGPRTIQYSVSATTPASCVTAAFRVGSTTVSIHQDGDGDVTPPVITPTVTGPLGGDGWYVGNVTVQWTVTDPESPIVSQGYNCGTVTTIATDAIYAPVTCDATSHGGSNTQTVVIRRDSTGPPLRSLHRVRPSITPASTVTPAFSCSEPNGYSGVATCAISEGSTPLNTTPGWHGLAVTATDRAGNSSTRRVEYFVGTGTCVPANVNLKGWWRIRERHDRPVGGVFPPPPCPRARFNSRQASRAIVAVTVDNVSRHPRRRAAAGDGRADGRGLLKVTGATGESATIVSKPAQYRIARYLDGTLRWAFNQKRRARLGEHRRRDPDECLDACRRRLRPRPRQHVCERASRARAAADRHAYRWDRTRPPR